MDIRKNNYKLYLFNKKYKFLKGNKMKYNIYYNETYKLDKYVKLGTLNKYDNGNMVISVTQEQLEQLLQAIKNNCFNDKKIKEYNNKKYYSLYVFEDTYNKQNNTVNNTMSLKSDSMDEVPF